MHVSHNSIRTFPSWMRRTNTIYFHTPPPKNTSFSIGSRRQGHTTSVHIWAVGTAPICTQTPKLQPRVVPCRYLYALNDSKIVILHITSQTTHKLREIEVKPIHTDLDPPTVVAKTFTTRTYTPPPTSITLETPRHRP